MKKAFLVISLLFTTNIFAHGDHAEPGAIPPAPHGGTISEAKHYEAAGHKHDHGKEEEKEVFFEGIYKGKSLKLYPLILDPKTYKAFLAQPVTEFKKTKIVLKDPRKKKEYKVKAISKGNYWEISMTKIRGRRFILHVSSTVDGEEYRAKIQIERK